MNKKILIITTGSLILTCVAVGIIFYLQTFKTVHFDIKPNDTSATVFTSDNKEVATLDKSTDIRLQPGDYTFITTGEKYDNTPKNFSVDETDTTVIVDPPYSAAYRDKILATELPAITKAINNAYPEVIKGFTLNKGNIYKDGLWYGTTLTQIIPNTAEQGDIYRTVLKKEKGTWVIKAIPALVLSAKEYPNIPIEILRSMNVRGGNSL